MKIPDLKLNKKMFVFAFFLIISTILWFLNALNQNYLTNLQFPVVFIHFPQDKINIKELPNKLKIKINADGFSILSYKLSSNFMPLKIDVSSVDLRLLSKSDSSKLFFLTNNLTRNLEAQFSEDFKILKIKPDSIYFNFTHITEKKVPVKLISEINYKNQFMLKNDIVIAPDSIIVKGPASLLDTIDFIKTKKLKLNKLSINVSQELMLETNKNLNYSQDYIDIDIDVEEYTETKIIIPIEIINLPDSLSIKIFPNKVNVKYLVGFSHYGKISDHEFRAIIDYKTINNNLNSKLKVQIMSIPNNIKSFSSKPSTVDYVIE